MFFSQLAFACEFSLGEKFILVVSSVLLFIKKSFLMKHGKPDEFSFLFSKTNTLKALDDYDSEKWLLDTI